ncbi:XRE family transcriptional regulator [Streptomycetaceae bacterium NBC_01309]
MRQLRKERLMTLEALAERSGVTKSYLSKVERGRSTPSIAVAAALARALDVHLDRLFSDADDLHEVTVTRAGERRPLTPDDESATRYEGIALDAGGKQMTPFMLRPPHDADRIPFRDHPGEELLFVHAGHAELVLPSHSIELLPGDAVYFNAATPHKVRSLGPDRATVLLVTTASPEPHPPGPPDPPDAPA